MADEVQTPEVVDQQARSDISALTTTVDSHLDEIKRAHARLDLVDGFVRSFEENPHEILNVPAEFIGLLDLILEHIPGGYQALGDGLIGSAIKALHVPVVTEEQQGQ